MFSYLSHALALSHVRWIRYFFAGRTAVRLSVLFLPSDPMFIKSNSTFECSNGWQNLRKLVVLPCSRLLLDTLAFLIVSRRQWNFPEYCIIETSQAFKLELRLCINWRLALELTCQLPSIFHITPIEPLIFNNEPRRVWPQWPGSGNLIAAGIIKQFEEHTPTPNMSRYHRGRGAGSPTNPAGPVYGVISTLDDATPSPADFAR